MLQRYIAIGLVFLIVGLLSASFGFFVLKRKFFGGFGMAMLIGAAGSIAGGFLDMVLGPLMERFSQAIGNINIFPALFFSLLLIFIFSSKQKNKDGGV